MKRLPTRDFSDSMLQRAKDLFERRRLDRYRMTDRWFAGLMGVQWIAGVAAALWISPKAWSGAFSSTHVHVYAAVFLGGLICSLPAYLAWRRSGSRMTRHVIAAAQML